MLISSWRAPLPTALTWFAVALAAFGASFGVGALRFQLLLRGAGLESGWATLLRAYVVASFFNLVLPGAILGDVYRFLDARRQTGQGSEVAGIVVLERLLSLAALGGIGLMVVPFIPLPPDQRHLGWVLVALCSSFIAVTLAALHPRANQLLRYLARRFAPLSPPLAARVERALTAVAALSANPSLLAGALALSLVMQWLPVLANIALAAPLHAGVAWHWIAVIVPFVTLMSLIPISIGGAGVREYLYVTLFGVVGMRPEVALSLSLSVFAVAIVWGLVGLAAFSAGRRTARALAPSPEA